jgi:hypothetical protein
VFAGKRRDAHSTGQLGAAQSATPATTRGSTGCCAWGTPRHPSGVWDETTVDLSWRWDEARGTRSPPLHV